jgi:hypothetical protein
MKELSIEELIAEVVANPAPTRVSPQPQPPPPAPATTQRSIVGKIVRRLTGRR